MGLLANHELLKNKGFNWGPEAKTAFERLKGAVSGVPILGLPDFNKPFILKTDACATGVGAVLMQEGRPLAFLNQALDIWGLAFMKKGF